MPGEVLKAFATKRRNRRAALKFLKRAMKRYGQPNVIVTDRLRSYRAAMKVIGNAAGGSIIGLKIHTSHSGDGRARCRNSGT